MIHELVQRYEHWRYKNLFLLIISVGVFVMLANNPRIISGIESLSQVNFFGAFVAGLLCASTFTVAPALLLLVKLSQHFNIFQVALMAGIGCTIGDFITMKVIKNEIFEELMPLFKHFRSKRLLYLFHTPYFAWLMPLIGVVIIASPFPDEIGLAMLGVKTFKDWQLLTLLFIVNTIGMFALIGLVDFVIMAL